MPRPLLNIILSLPRHLNKRVRFPALQAISLASLLGRRAQRLRLSVRYMAGRKHLPIVELPQAA